MEVKPGKAVGKDCPKCKGQSCITVQNGQYFCLQCKEAVFTKLQKISAVGGGGTRPVAEAADGDEQFSFGPGTCKVAIVVNVKDKKDKQIHVDFDGYIGGWDGITAKDFERDIKAAVKSSGQTRPKIRINIHSGGGDIFEATKIVNIIDELDADVETRIIGVAASAATYISQYASPGKRKIAKNAHFMVHGARGVAYGTEEDISSYLELLQNANGILTEVYADATGKSESEIAGMLKRDNWMTAKKAVENGFADEVVTSVRVTPHVKPQSKVSGMADGLFQLEPGQVAAAAEELSKIRARHRSKKGGDSEMSFEAWAEEQGFVLSDMSEEAVATLRNLYETQLQGSADSDGDGSETDSAEDGAAEDVVDEGDDESEEEEEAAEEAAAASTGNGQRRRRRVAATRNRTLVTRNRDGHDHSDTVAKLRHEKKLRAICGERNDGELLISALEGGWSLEKAELEAVKWDNKRLQAKQKKSENFGAFNVAVPTGKSEVKTRTKVIEAAVCLAMSEYDKTFTEADLLDPWGQVKTREAARIGFNANIKGFDEQTLDLAHKHYPYMDMQTMILEMNQLHGTDTAKTWRGDESIVAAYDPPRASFDTVTVPSVYKTTVERAIIANFRKAAPQWKRFCGTKSVPNFKPHQEYRVYGSGRWERQTPTGNVNEGQIELDTKHEFRVETEGQYLMINRENIENGDLGVISDISRSFIMYGNYAPEFAAWRQAGATLITAAATSFTFDFANLEALWVAYCTKTQFDPDSVMKDKARALSMAIDVEPAVIVAHKTQQMNLRKLLFADTQAVAAGGAASNEVTEVATLNPYKDMFVPVTSSYVKKTDGVAMIPSPNAAPVIKVILLRGREVPFIRTVEPAPNQIPGFGVMGYIDVAAQDTSESFLVTTAADLA